MSTISRFLLVSRLRAKYTTDLSSDKGGGGSTCMVALIVQAVVDRGRGGGRQPSAMTDDVTATAHAESDSCNSHLDTHYSVRSVGSSLPNE